MRTKVCILKLVLLNSNFHSLDNYVLFAVAGHVFKSLNTSGLIPKQGKSIADRIDGIWYSAKLST